MVKNYDYQSCSVMQIHASGTGMTNLSLDYATGHAWTCALPSAEANQPVLKPLGLNMA